jgi:hypothetical protein
MIGEYRFQMRNPIAALAGLPVGDAQKVRAERGAHGCEYFGRVGKRDAADKVDMARGHVLHPFI